MNPGKKSSDWCYFLVGHVHIWESCTHIPKKMVRRMYEKTESGARNQETGAYFKNKGKGNMVGGRRQRNEVKNQESGGRGRMGDSGA